MMSIKFKVRIAGTVVAGAMLGTACCLQMKFTCSAGSLRGLQGSDEW